MERLVTLVLNDVEGAAVCPRIRMAVGANQFVGNVVRHPTLEQDQIVSCRAYGMSIGIRACPDVLHYLPTLVPGVKMEHSTVEPNIVFEFSRTTSAHGEPHFTVTENGTPFFSSADIHLAVLALESQAHQQLATLTEKAVFVHAGVVAWRGRALVIPGPSNSGKSTLVAALVAAGAAYYSDEYAVIGLDGRIYSFARPLRLRPDMLDKESFTPAAGAMSHHDSPGPLPLGWVLTVPYSAPTMRNPRLLTRGQTLLTLLANTVAVRRQSELTVKTLKLAVNSAIGLYFERGDADKAAQAIIRFVDRTLLDSTNN